MKLIKIFVVLATLTVSSQTILALESWEGKLTNLEPTYMPNNIRFHMDSGNSTCPAGKALKWDKDNTENHNVIYSTLLAAFLAGRTIKLYIQDGDTTCTGSFLHLKNY